MTNKRQPAVQRDLQFPCAIQGVSAFYIADTKTATKTHNSGPDATSAPELRATKDHGFLLCACMLLRGRVLKSATARSLRCSQRRRHVESFLKNPGKKFDPFKKDSSKRTTFDPEALFRGAVAKCLCTPPQKNGFHH